MIPYGLFTQLLLILLSVSLIFTYIKPTLAKIDETQNEIGIYQTEIDKVTAVNVKLAELVSEQNQVPQSDRDSLRTYMPDSVDTIQVPRDLYAIAAEAGVILTGIEYIGPEKEDPNNQTDSTAQNSTVQKPEAHRFEMSFDGTYQQIKTALSLMEQNHYPLEVHELTIARNEGGFLTVDLAIITYDSFTPVTVDMAIQ